MRNFFYIVTPKVILVSVLFCEKKSVSTTLTLGLRVPSKVSTLVLVQSASDNVHIYCHFASFTLPFIRYRKYFAEFGCQGRYHFSV